MLSSRAFGSNVVPLCGVVCDIKIVDFIAEVTIEQRYENQEKHPIEAT